MHVTSVPWIPSRSIHDIRLQMEGLDEGLDIKDPHFQNAIQETHPPLQGSPLRLLIFGADIDHEVRIMHGILFQIELCSDLIIILITVLSVTVTG